MDATLFQDASTSFQDATLFDNTTLHQSTAAEYDSEPIDYNMTYDDIIDDENRNILDDAMIEDPTDTEVENPLPFDVNEEFHEIEGQGVTVEQLAFVFRNVNGSKEGKTAGNR